MKNYIQIKNQLEVFSNDFDIDNNIKSQNKYQILKEDEYHVISDWNNSKSMLLRTKIKSRVKHLPQDKKHQNLYISLPKIQALPNLNTQINHLKQNMKQYIKQQQQQNRKDKLLYTQQNSINKISSIKLPKFNSRNIKISDKKRQHSYQIQQQKSIQQLINKALKNNHRKQLRMRVFEDPNTQFSNFSYMVQSIIIPKGKNRSVNLMKQKGQQRNNHCQ